jgi:EAL and modified HD-GYP domain-containing signal transduction protein
MVGRSSGDSVKSIWPRAENHDVSAQPAPQPHEQDLSASTVMISRQPVVDARMRIAGYRLAYATELGHHVTHDADEHEGSGGASPLQLFHDALSVVGLEELVGSSVAHLPISRKLLFAIGVPPVRPDRVVLRMPYREACDPDLTQLFDQLAGRGFTLSLNSPPGPDFSTDLLDVFGSVEFDLATWSREDLATAVPRVQGRRAVAVASNVLDHDQFTWAQELGIELFEGPFYSTPRVTSTREIPVDRIGAIAALARIQGYNAPVEELEEVIGRDIGLSVKLLRYINSAFFGLRSQISSIRHAVMMLGSHGVARWALLVALVGGPDAPRELSVMALTRGRLCEVLGAGRPACQPDELFMIGVLSAADVLMGVPLERILAELPLTESVRAALLTRSGPAGSALDAALAYERGDFSAASLDAHRHGLLGVYRDALQWATSTVASLV